MCVINRMLISMLLAPMLLLLGGHSGAEAPEGAASAPDAASTPAKGMIAGTIVETMDAAGYTYVRVDTGTQKVWAAAPQTSVAVGEKVEFPDGMAMRNFHSNALDRTFDVVYFASSLKGAGGSGAAGHGARMPAAPPGHGAMPRGVAPAPSLDLSDIEKAEDGHTIAELFAGKQGLDGVQTAVRGRVVKYNAGIMGRNWLHIRDGSGSEGTNDLTVTTADTARVGDLVVVRGTLRANQDFGRGYSYDLLLEKATVEVE